jgi:hypothetical protein
MTKKMNWKNCHCHDESSALMKSIEAQWGYSDHFSMIIYTGLFLKVLATKI